MSWPISWQEHVSVNIFRALKGIVFALKMRWLLYLLFLGLSGLVQGLSSGGDRLLVVIEEAAERSKYSQLWSDLKGTPLLFELLSTFNGCLHCVYIDRGYTVSFESPKNEKLALLKHGERVYDHIILLPPKSKGA